MTRYIERETSGSTSIIWALMVLPLLVFVGAALDFNNRETAQRQIRTAADAAAIAAVRFAMTESDDSDAVKTAARNFFRENLPHQWPVTTITPVVSFEANNFVTVKAEYDMPTAILSIAGIPSLKVSTESTAVYAAPTPLEIALVLDNSNSMSGSRIDDLRTAANALVDDVVKPGSDQVKIAVVPFNNFVNVGVGNRYAAWIDVPADYTETRTHCPVDHAASIANGCTEESAICHSDGVAYDCHNWVCPAGESVATSCTTSVDTFTWYGCAKARSVPLDVQDISYFSNRIRGRMDDGPWGCPTPLLPLTSNKTQITSRLAGMFAESDTMIYEGLVWGYRALSSGAPFTEGAEETAFAAAGGRKIIILMSDGENSRSPDTGDGDHWDDDVAFSNGRTRAACDEIRTAGIDVYVVAVGVSDALTLDLLSECAGLGSRFYDIHDSADLTSIFKAISTDLRDIALSK